MAHAVQHLTPYAMCLTLDPLQARIITEGTYPYRVVFANSAWEEMCGWTAEEVHGLHGLSFLQGPETEKAKLKRVSEAVKYGEVRICSDRQLWLHGQLLWLRAWTMGVAARCDWIEGSCKARLYECFWLRFRAFTQHSSSACAVNILPLPVRCAASVGNVLPVLCAACSQCVFVMHADAQGGPHYLYPFTVP
jgi:hypothetical protein